MDVPPPMRISKPFSGSPPSSRSRSLGRKARVVDVGDDVVVAAAGEGGLPLARERLRVLVADEVTGVGREVRRDVERLLQLHAREGIAGDVADGVAARLAGDEARVAEDAHDVRGVGELDEVDLQVLAGGDVALLERRVLADDVAECLEVPGRERAAGDLDAHHLHVRLALPIDAAHQAVHDELLLGRPLAVEVAGRLRLEVVDLLGDVGQHTLRVVELQLLVDGLGTSDDGTGRGAGHLFLLLDKESALLRVAEKGAVFCRRARTVGPMVDNNKRTW